MDKLKLAHEYALKQMESLSENSTMQSLVSVAWKYADAMQAEADKRENKERPDVLKEEWQPDWSQAPEWAKWWCAGQLSGKAMWSKNKPHSILLHGVSYWGIDSPDGENTDAPSFNYQGNWQDSLRKRPEALCGVDWSAAPKNAFQWQMINNEAYWRIEIMGGLDTEPAPSFGFTGSHIVERPDGF